MICLYLKEQGHEVMGLARSESRFVETFVADACDFSQVERVVRMGEFDAVINCVGLLNQFAENDRPAAVLVNSYLPHFLAGITRDLPTRIIHMSTDCVFSGKQGQYTEDAQPDGATFYDRSKALGELNDEKNLTLRNSIVGPDIKESGIGLLNWFMKQKGPVSGYTGAIWTGQTTLQLAKTMEAAVKCGASGLYHMVPDCSINKYELLGLFNRHIRKESIQVDPQPGVVADKSLVRTRFEGFPYEIPGYEEMVRQLGDWMRAHKELYPHYNL